MSEMNHTVSRKEFLAGAAAAIGVAAAGLADEAKADISVSEPVTAQAGKWMSFEEVAEARKALIDSKEDYVCADGSVIPAVYVKLRSLINSYGIGLGSVVNDDSFKEVMYLFTEEDAEHYLEMPMGYAFSAADYAHASGRTEEECAEILADLAERALLYSMVRGGTRLYATMGEAHGIWEFNVDKRTMRNADPENGIWTFDEELATLYTYHDLMWGDDAIDHIFNSYTPFFYVIPPSKDVVVDDEILLFDDIDAIIARNAVFAVSPCQCRGPRLASGMLPEDDGHPMETCISMGEMAQWFIENNQAREVSAEECRAILQKGIDAGLVMQSVYTRDTEVICQCHGDCCDVLSIYVAMGDRASSFSSWPNVSHYTLVYDQEGCLHCGACAERCPMFAISMDEEGYAIANPNQCVRCGQCGLVCPASVRKLKAKDPSEIIDMPKTLIDDYNEKAAIRFSLNKIW